MPLPVLRPLIYTLQALMALVINGRFGRSAILRNNARVSKHYDQKSRSFRKKNPDIINKCKS